MTSGKLAPSGCNRNTGATLDVLVEARNARRKPRNADPLVPNAFSMRADRSTFGWVIRTSVASFRRKRYV
jgi:hypothetical protein